MFGVFATTRVLVDVTDPNTTLDLWWPTMLLSITIISQLAWVFLATETERRHLVWIFGARGIFLLLIWLSWWSDSFLVKALCYLASMVLVVIYVRQVVKPVVAR